MSRLAAGRTAAGTGTDAGAGARPAGRWSRLPRRRRSGWWGRHRDIVVPVAVGSGLLLSVLLGAGQLGVDALLRLAGLSALVLVGIGAAAVAALALVLRRRLAELRHLPDLGRAFVTTHEEGRLVSVRRGPTGDVVLEVSSGSRQTVVLDDDGAPDHVSAGGATTSFWVVSGSADADADRVLPLSELIRDGVPVRVVSEGVVTLTGPLTTAWRLEAANGLLLASRG